jgi:hypothetical protein
MNKLFHRKSIPITRELVPHEHRNLVLFNFFARVIDLELLVNGFLLTLEDDYQPGEHQLFLINNNSCYLAPKGDETCVVVAENGGCEELLSKDALAVLANLLCFSYLTHSMNISFSERCEDLFQRLMAFASQHDEADRIRKFLR